MGMLGYVYNVLLLFVRPLRIIGVVCKLFVHFGSHRTFYPQDRRIDTCWSNNRPRYQTFDEGNNMHD
jgi:hypothetical protein